MSDEAQKMGDPTAPFQTEEGQQLPPHVALMAQETQAVLVRYRNLIEFRNTKTFAELSVVDTHLIDDQIKAMETYGKTLAFRYCMALLTQ